MPYTVYVTPAALNEIKRLPGHVRQRAKSDREFRRGPPPAEE